MATRFIFSDTEVPTGLPAFQSYTHAMVGRRRLCREGRDSSTLVSTAITPDSADDLTAGDVGIRQYVSDPLAVVTFTSGDAFKYAIQGLEAHANNNLQFQIWMGIISIGGTTALATIRSKVAEGTELGTTLANRFYSGTLSGSYTTAYGNRLVVELSFVGTPGPATGGVQGHNATARFGGTGAGGYLPENDTETGTTFVPWIEFANTLTFTKGTPPSHLLRQPNFIPTRRLI